MLLLLVPILDLLKLFDLHNSLVLSDHFIAEFEISHDHVSQFSALFIYHVNVPTQSRQIRADGWGQ